jgi:hypothetical protein
LVDFIVAELIEFTGVQSEHAFFGDAAVVFGAHTPTLADVVDGKLVVVEVDGDVGEGVGVGERRHVSVQSKVLHPQY